MTPEELALAITVFRKETEDLIVANNVKMFHVQYGTFTILAAETKSIALTTAYTYSYDYEVKIFEATDTDGVNIVDALTIPSQETTYFEIYSPRAATVRWQTVLRTPLIDFWT